MNVAVEKRTRIRFPVDTLVLFAYDDAGEPAGQWQPIDVNLQRKLNQAAAHESFKGSEKSVLVFTPPDGKPARRVVVAGLGKKERLDAEKLRRACAAAWGRLKSWKAEELHVLPPSKAVLSVVPQEQAIAITEGFALSSYAFDKYKTKKNDAPAAAPPRLRIVAETDRDLKEMSEGAARGAVLAESACYTRDLVNEHPMVCTPRYLAQQAMDLARGCKEIRVRVIDEKQARKMGMGGLIGVSLGSSEPPRFVHLEYRPSGGRKTIALCGKGITFDSGGLCLKPADGMLQMKNDMAGAGAVLGVFRGLRALKPRVNVHGIFAATENMPGPGAYKTRDILRALNGKTMEIINTDAEGRLVLADALSYASKLKPDQIIDLATLTGACVVALGPSITGVFSTDQNLVTGLLSAASAAGEKAWQMPVEDEYFEMIKSDVADMKNSGGRWGGSITAALFLKEFVDPVIPWAHLDIAGPALTDASKDYRPAGGTGVMVRTLLRYLESQAS